MAALVYIVLLVFSVGLSQAVQVTYGPECSFVQDIPAVQVTVHFGSINPLTGPGIPAWYIIQIRDKTNDRPWEQYGQRQDYPDTSQQDYEQTFQITEVRRGMYYEVRIILQEKIYGTIYGANDVPSTTIFTGNSHQGGIRLMYPPHCYNVDYGVLVVTVNLGVKNPIQGHGVPDYYILQIREDTDDEPWEDYQTVPYPTQLKYYQRTFYIKKLKSGKVYELRVVLVANGVKYDDNTVPSSLCGTKCDIPKTYDYDISARIQPASDLSATLVVSWTYKLANDHWCPQIGSEVTYIVDSEQHVDIIEGSSIHFLRWTSNDVITLFVRIITSGGYFPYSKEFVYPSQQDQSRPGIGQEYKGPDYWSNSARAMYVN